MKLIDLTRKRFGLLTVLRKYGYSGKEITWLCKCDCGKESVVIGRDLRSGNTKSCGCIKSFGEQKIISLLQQYGIPFEKEKIFDKQTNYRYDFYIDNKYVIEYDCMDDNGHKIQGTYTCSTLEMYNSTQQ